MLLAALSDASVDLTLTVSNTSGGVAGLTATVRIRDGSTTNSYLDFADNTFKTSGWTNRDGAMSDIGDGDYTFELDVAAIVGLANGDFLVAEYHTTGANVVDASETIAIGELDTCAATLTVCNTLGGVTGLTAVVEIRRGGTPDEYLDWNDLTFKTAGWGTRQASMTDIGRGHYHRALDVSSLIPALGPNDSIVAEFETTGAVTLSASDTYELAPSTAGSDTTAPEISNITPAQLSEVAPGDPVGFDVTDNSGLFTTIVVYYRDSDTGETEMIHDGSSFSLAFNISTRTAIAGGWRYSLLRRSGWPAERAFKIPVVAYDAAGNAVELA